MKNYWKAYNTFACRIYCLVMFIAVPLFIWGLHFVMLQLISPIDILNMALYEIVFITFGDYFTFNGIPSKEYNFGLLRCTLKGREYIRHSIIADEVVRFLHIVLVSVGCALISIATVPCDFVHEYLLMHITLVFLVYGASTFSLMIARHVTSFMSYLGVAGLLNMVLGVVIAVGIGLFHAELQLISLYPWLIVGIATSLILPVISNKIIIKNYNRCFMEGK
ncbi:MAG: hypothetical protein K6A05_07905 [Lachnospiraceae bacterium]|nr:hypothetical protein [Lachnospiraceae bacterium]